MAYGYLAGGGQGSLTALPVSLIKGSLIVVEVAQVGGSLGTISDGYNSYNLYSSNNSNTAPQSYNFYAITQIDLPAGTNITYTPNGSPTSTSIAFTVFVPQGGEKFALPIISTSSTDLVTANTLSTTINGVIAPSVVIGTTVMSNSSSYNVYQDLSGGSAWTGTFFDISTGLGSAFKITKTNTNQTFTSSFSTSTAFQTLLAFPIVLDVAQVQSTSGGTAPFMLYNAFTGESTSGANSSFNIISTLTPQRAQGVASNTIFSSIQFNPYSNAIAETNAKEYLNFQSSVGSSIVAQSNGRAYLTPATNPVPNQSGGVSGGSIAFAPITYTISSKATVISSAYLDQTQSIFAPLTISSSLFALSNAKEFANFSSILYLLVTTETNAYNGINFKTNIVQSITTTSNGYLAATSSSRSISLKLSAISNGYFDPTLSLINIIYDSATGIALSNAKEFANFKSLLVSNIVASTNAYDSINFKTNIIQSVNATTNGSISLAPIAPTLPLRLSATSNGYIDPVFNTNLLVTSSTAFAQSNAKEFANFKSVLYPIINAESNAFDKINFKTNIIQSINSTTDADSTFVMSFTIKPFASIASNGYFDPLLNPVNVTTNSSTGIANSNANIKPALIASILPTILIANSNSSDKINFKTNIIQSVNAVVYADSLFAINFLPKIFGSVSVNGYFDPTLNPINSALNSATGIGKTNGYFNLALTSLVLPISGNATANAFDKINFQANIKQSANIISDSDSLFAINFLPKIFGSVASNGYIVGVISAQPYANSSFAIAESNGYFNLALISLTLPILGAANSNTFDKINFQTNIKQSVNAVSNGSLKENLPIENIKNGLFEIGTESWSGINNAILISNNSYSGGNSLLISEVDPYTEHQAGPLGAKQDFYAYGPNRNYNLTAYVQNTSSNARNMYLQIAWSDNTVSQGIPVYVDQSSGWVQLSLNTSSNSVGIATAYIVTSAPFNSLNGDTALIDNVSMQIKELSTADYGISNVSSSMSAKATSAASAIINFVLSPILTAFSYVVAQEKFSIPIPLSLDPINGAVAEAVSNGAIITTPRTVFTIFPAFNISNANSSFNNILNLGKQIATINSNGYFDPAYNVNVINPTLNAAVISNAKEYLNFQSLLYPVITAESNARDAINFKTNIIQLVNSTTSGSAFINLNAATLKLALNASSSGYIDPTISSLAIITPSSNAITDSNGIFAPQVQYLPSPSLSAVTNGYVGVISLKSNILNVLQLQSSSDADSYLSLRMVVSPIKLSTTSNAYIDSTISSILIDGLVLIGSGIVSGLGSLSTTLNIKPVDATGDSNVELISQSSGYINTRAISPILSTLSTVTNANSIFNGTLRFAPQQISAISQAYIDANVNITALITSPKASGLSSAKEYFNFQISPILNASSTINGQISTNSKTFITQPAGVISQAYISSVLTQKLSIQSVNAISSGYIDPTVSSINNINLTLNAFANSTDSGGPGLALNIQPVFIPIAPDGNILANPSFELGGSGWYGLNVPSQITTDYYYDGTQSFLVQQPLNTYDSTEYLTYPLGIGQTFKSVIGRTYQLSAYVQNISGDAPRLMYASIAWSNGQVSTGTPVYVLPSDGWVNLTVTGIAQAAGFSSAVIITSAPFDSLNGGNQAVVDNVSLQVIDTLNVNNTLGLTAFSNGAIATRQTMPVSSLISGTSSYAIINLVPSSIKLSLSINASSDADIIANRNIILPLFASAVSQATFPRTQPVPITYASAVSNANSLFVFKSILQTSVSQAESNGYFDPTITPIATSIFSLTQAPISSGSFVASIVFAPYSNAGVESSARDAINFKTNIVQSINTISNASISYNSPTYLKNLIASATSNGDVAGLLSAQPITLKLSATATSSGATGEKLQYFLIPYQVADVVGNNLFNGSFDADVSFWSGIANNIYVRNDLGYDLKNSLIINSPDYAFEDFVGPQGAKQDFKTYLGRTYSAEAYVQNLTGTAPRDMYIQIEWSNGSVVKGKTMSVNPSDGWVRLSLDFASSPTNGTATIFVVTSANISLFNVDTAAIDFVSVTQLPSVLPSANGFALSSSREKIAFQSNIVQSVTSEINGFVNPGLINNIKSQAIQSTSNGQISINLGQNITIQPTIAESNGYFDSTLSPIRIITLEPLNAVSNSFAREKITLVEQNTIPYSTSGNLLVNPTFAQGSYGWSALAAATVATSSYGYDDANSLMVLDATDGLAGITQDFVVGSGLNYTLSAYINNLTGITPRLMYVQILWADGSTSTSDIASVNSSDGWVRLYVTGVSPKAGKATVVIVTSTPGFFESQEQTLIDCVLLEQSDILNPFYYGINKIVTGIAADTNGIINPKVISYVPAQLEAQSDADIVTSSYGTIKQLLSATSNGFIDPLVSSIGTFSPYSNAIANTNGNLITRVLYTLDGSSSASTTNGNIPLIALKSSILGNQAQAQSNAYADAQIVVAGTIKGIIGIARTDADSIFNVTFNPYSNASASTNGFEKFDLVQTIQPGDITNLVNNGNFELGTTYWSGITNTLYTTNSVAYSGVNSLLINDSEEGLSGATQNFYALQGGNYNFSAYVQNLAGIPRYMWLQIAWADGTYSQTTPTTISQGDGWVQLVLQTNAGYGKSGIATAYIITSDGTLPETGAISAIDNVVLTTTTSVLPYFDTPITTNGIKDIAISNGVFNPTFKSIIISQSEAISNTISNVGIKSTITPLLGTVESSGYIDPTIPTTGTYNPIASAAATTSGYISLTSVISPTITTAIAESNGLVSKIVGIFTITPLIAQAVSSTQGNANVFNAGVIIPQIGKAQAESSAYQAITFAFTPILNASTTAQLSINLAATTLTISSNASAQSFAGSFRLISSDPGIKLSIVNQYLSASSSAYIITGGAETGNFIGWGMPI